MKDEQTILVAIDAIRRAIRGAELCGDMGAAERYRMRLQALEWCMEQDTSGARIVGEFVDKAAVLIAEHQAKRNARLN